MSDLKKQESFRPVPPAIPDCMPVDPEQLPAEFRKFRKDVLFFIDHVAYYSRDELKKPAAERKAVPRVLALTPQAVFVCDARGAMDRASKVDLISLVLFDTVTIRRFLGSSTNSRVLLKVPDEYDIIVEFEGDDVSATKARKFCDQFCKVTNFKTGGSLEARKVRDGEKLEDVYNGEAPTTFISPQQIIALNQLRRDFEQRVAACQEEYYTVEEKLRGRRAIVQNKRREYALLESSVGSDIAELQGRLEATRRQQTDAAHRATNVELELVRMLGEVDSLRSQLSEERANFDAIVKARIAAGDTPAVQEQVEMANTLKRSQAREIDKANNALAAAKAKFTKPDYARAPPALAQRAEELEEKLRVGLDRWERDSSANTLMHRRLEEEGDALATQVETLRALLQKKAAAIAARQPRAPPAVVASAAAGADDFLFGGGGAAPAAPATGFDDDLLGGGGGAAVAVAPAAAGAAVVLDDDLLGGGGGAAAPAATLAPPEGGEGLL
jgi:hypothetical protein